MPVITAILWEHLNRKHGTYHVRFNHVTKWHISYLESVIVSGIKSWHSTMKKLSMSIYNMILAMFHIRQLVAELNRTTNIQQTPAIFNVANSLPLQSPAICLIRPILCVRNAWYKCVKSNSVYFFCLSGSAWCDCNGCSITYARTWFLFCFIHRMVVGDGGVACRDIF